MTISTKKFVKFVELDKSKLLIESFGSSSHILLFFFFFSEVNMLLNAAICMTIVLKL